MSSVSGVPTRGLTWKVFKTLAVGEANGRYSDILGGREHYSKKWTAIPIVWPKLQTKEGQENGELVCSWGQKFSLEG